MLVTGTSAVGTRYSSSRSATYIWCSLSGSCPVPRAEAALTSNGVHSSRYPAPSASSSIREMSARSRRAPGPVNRMNPEPAIFAPRSRSKSPNCSAISQCGGVLPSGPGSPQRRMTGLSSAPPPSGTDGCGRFGMRSRSCSIAAVTSPSSTSSPSIRRESSAMCALSASPSSRCPVRISSPSCLFPALRSARSSLASASRARRRASASNTRSTTSTGSPLRATASFTPSGSSRMSATPITPREYPSRPRRGAAP